MKIKFLFVLVVLSVLLSACNPSYGEISSYIANNAEVYTNGVNQWWGVTHPAGYPNFWVGVIQEGQKIVPRYGSGATYSIPSGFFRTSWDSVPANIKSAVIVYISAILRTGMFMPRVMLTPVYGQQNYYTN